MPLVTDKRRKRKLKTKSVRGRILAQTEIAEGRKKRQRGIASRDDKHYTEPFDFIDGENIANVCLGHEVTSSLNYQTVRTTVIVTLPCAATPASVEAAKDQGWAYVERYCAERSQWAAEVLQTLSEVHKTNR